MTVWSHEARRPDVVVVDRVKKETMIIDILILGDTRVCNKEVKKENRSRNTAC